LVELNVFMSGPEEFGRENNYNPKYLFNNDESSEI
jgi:hypothetical protein